jgi:hypothetical protein
MPTLANSISGQASAKTESGLWQALIQSQEEYSRSLASLDAQLFDRESCNQSSLDLITVEQAGGARRLAYWGYRQAMADLAGFFRE